MIKKVLNKLGMYTYKHEEVFTKVYTNKEWGEKEGSKFYSGPGSDEAYSGPYINLITEFVKENNIQSIVDLGCGDFRIGGAIARRTNVKYTGVDVVKQLVQYNNENYGNDRTVFLHKNIVNDPLPNGELCLIRQVLQHLSNDDILKILQKCKQYQYLIITEHLPTELSTSPNIDKPANAGIRYYLGSGVYLDKLPFNKKIKELLSTFPEEHPNSKISTFQVFL